MFAVLLPFAVQFVHSFHHHSHHVCNEYDLHIDEHEFDCSVFHFKINQNSVDFCSEIVINENTFSETKFATFEALIASIKLTHKSSRAPPVLL